MSDHFSGPRALAGPAADITDLWAFPSPQRPDHLVLAMGVQPAAMPGARFSEAITCRFRLRPLTISGASFPFAPEAEELVVDCGFAAPGPAGSNGTLVQDAWCKVPSGETVRFVVGDAQGATGAGVRAYAGLRADPFFLDVPAWGESVQAVVVLREAGAASEAELLEWCKGRIASFKRPKSVLFVAESEMPRTATGKIQHRVLRDRLAARAKAVP